MKPIHLVTMGIVLAGLLAACVLWNWRAGMMWDNDFRHRCVALKRVYDATNGSCLGEASGSAAALQARSSKAPGERSWNDLAAACKREDGWLNSSASDDVPKCIIAGSSREMAPP